MTRPLRNKKTFIIQTTNGFSRIEEEVQSHQFYVDETGNAVFQDDDETSDFDVLFVTAYAAKNWFKIIEIRDNN